MIELRESYQRPAYERLRELVASGVKRILLQMPTGAGKTEIAAYLLSRATAKGARAHFWVHRRELVRQSLLTLDRAGVHAGVIASSFPANALAPVQVCSIQSLPRRIHKIEVPKLIIADEIHHAPASVWSRLLNHYSGLGAIIIGLSATPWRLSGEGLRPWFDELVIGPSTAELIKDGWLSRYRLFAPGHLNLAGVHVTAGDYDKKELATVMTTSGVSGDCLAHYQKHVPGKRALIFTWSIESSIDIAARFNQAGIPAAHIDGTTDAKLRDRAIQMFSAGQIKVLSNVDIASEGLNIPGIEALFMLRPTQSLVLYLQAIGRALRPAEGKTEAWIFDHAGNSRRHGMPDDLREWTLDGQPKKRKKKSDREDAVRVCPKCTEAHGMHIRVCTCGYLLINAREMDVDESAELAEVDPRQIQQQRRDRLREQGRAKDMESLIAFAQKKGYKNPHAWAAIMLRARREKADRIAAKKAEARPADAPITQDVEEQWLF